ncbi:MAG: sulfatase-like hydrolase/transferase [Aggregatilineales bacterium]
MAQPPNIIFILADDMGYGDFSAFNDGLSQTPALDSLMDESLCLTQQYTASPVCNPSRASLLTGRYPHRTGSIDTLEWRGLERLALREVTLAQLLNQAGYITGHIGKWHLGSFDLRYSPTQRGFDESVCFRGGMHDYYDWRIEYNDQPVRSDGRYLTDVWTDEAVSFIERHKHDTPFFLNLNYNAPHTPLQAPEEDTQPFRDKNQFPEGVSRIYGMIRRMDAGIMRVLDTLDACGLRENTVVIFTSDNGPELNIYGDDASTDTRRFNCNFNGAKGVVYEGGVRVPLIVRWNAGLDGGGRQFDGMAHFTDWFTTLLAMAEINPPDDRMIDGINLLPVLRGESNDICDRRFWQWNRYTPVKECNAAMREGDWKLIFPAIPEAMQVFDGEWLDVSMYHYEYFVENGIITDPDPERNIPPPAEPELYNITDDPEEMHNLARQEPARVNAMRLSLENWFDAVEADRRTIHSEA